MTVPKPVCPAMTIDNGYRKIWHSRARLSILGLMAPPPGAERCGSGAIIRPDQAAPAEFGIARSPRSLGVALRRVTVRHGAKFMLFDAGDERLTTGFHAYEADGHLRWTDGCAELPAKAFARVRQGRGGDALPGRGDAIPG
jgi:hypothetical protein